MVVVVVVVVIVVVVAVLVVVLGSSGGGSDSGGDRGCSTGSRYNKAGNLTTTVDLTCLWHSEKSLFCRDSKLPQHGDSHSPSHNNSICVAQCVITVSSY